MYIIVESTDGYVSDMNRLMLATESVYGGKLLPAFNTRKEANNYVKKRADNSYRNFEVKEIR